MCCKHGRPSIGPPAEEPRPDRSGGVRYTPAVDCGSRARRCMGDDRRRAVILHEVAHVARYDCLTQMMASGACAMYWFHPAAWWVARRLRIERELACDDRVIAAGTQAARIRGASARDRVLAGGIEAAPALAVSMARPRQLEGRMLAALDDARDPQRAARSAFVVPASPSLPSCCFPWRSRRRRLPHRTRHSNACRRAPAFAPPVQDRQLKAIEWPFGDVVRGLARAAADVLGLAQDGLPGTWEIRAASAGRHRSTFD